MVNKVFYNFNRDRLTKEVVDITLKEEHFYNLIDVDVYAHLFS